MECAERIRAVGVHAVVLGLTLLFSLAAPAGGGADEAVDAASARGTELLRIRHEVRGGSTWIVLEGSAPLGYSYSSAGPRDAVVELPAVSAPELPSVVEIGTPDVDSIRLSELDPASGTGLRVEVQLVQAARHRVFPSANDLNLVFTRSRPRPTWRESSEFEAAGSPATEAAVPAPIPGSTEPDSTPPPAESPPAASSLLGVSVQPGDDSVRVEVQADGRLSYEDFVVDVPIRLVVDLVGVVSRVERDTIPVGRGAVRRVRITQHSSEPRPVTRLVVDLREQVSYEILPREGGIAIVLELRAGQME